MSVLSYVVTCPHCGASKLLAFSEERWSESNSVFWSDGRTESHTWFEPADVQQCPECMHFFMMPDDMGKLEVRKSENIDTGRLPYNTLKLALPELSGDEKVEMLVRRELWWAFNRQYLVDDSINVPDSEISFNDENMLWLLHFQKNRNDIFSWTEFELNRLLGNTDRCEEMICNLSFPQYQKMKTAKYGAIRLSVDVQKRMYNRMIDELNNSLKMPRKPYQR